MDHDEGAKVVAEGPWVGLRTLNSYDELSFGRGRPGWGTSSDADIGELGCGGRGTVGIGEEGEPREATLDLRLGGGDDVISPLAVLNLGEGTGEGGGKSDAE